MSHHTNTSHRQEVGRKSRPMMHTQFKRKSREEESHSSTYLNFPKSPEPVSMKGGGKDLASLAAASKGRRDESGEAADAADAADDGWILGVKLGSGTFGDVHKAYTTRREGSKVWACKQLKDLKKVPKLEREFELMKGCKHVHIIQYDSVDL